ncbi:hypothetical protein [Ancylobacter mangrovi]|uniref:hypothetical protein n=1 Tax=Ancylobacter mangrovi TaxID=2972472 RepID=UPI002162A71F|nr:hypothetical protein [Ancylobacter mangrovi]
MLLLAALALPAPTHAQSSPTQACADRWNQMKAQDKTGDLTYRDFARQCLAELSDDDGAAADSPEPAKPGDSKPAAKPSGSGAPVPTGPAATAAQPSIKQCADLWNEMKAKNQTGDFTYREFAQQCLAGTAAGANAAKPSTPPAKAPETGAAPKNPGSDAAAKPRTSVPSVGTRPIGDATADADEQDEEKEDERAALNRCNAAWKVYKASHNLTGAKAWHVFMAKCLP